MGVNIRSAEISDAKGISELISPLAKKYVCPTCDASVHDILLNSMSEENVEKYLSTNYTYVVAVTANGEMVGVAGVRDNSHLYHLFVDDNFQGNGLSRQLWEAVKEEAIKNGNSGIFTVNSAVNAENVYLRFGFKRTEGIRNRQGMIDIPMLLEFDY
ncbi:GNAT family N-acetyltransferase [Vibrio splendidus]|uniref:GNAT family N-acetyltransferase n=1 Tax=Vibrio TaxID=662 RepID=UPI0002DDB6D1|nr:MULTISPECIES: GNAT family N-acetyltransferase [Vibrio]MBO7910874.1 GNAT family N-acetyltransferase [Vibrio sp. G41H]MBT9243652.1 GNAT family N-acetyltransferase [Vibrio splendidus]MCF7489636.1 GNAT family N-acetyltransferase [Vibrio sp. G-C-1]MDP2614878.1 GNAT family N-acetyltransferase [Vibrio splendidus]OEF27100.1 GNAT family N-acetyltransferase [Vibrio splendidus 1S-124]